MIHHVNRQLVVLSCTESAIFEVALPQATEDVTRLETIFHVHDSIMRKLEMIGESLRHQISIFTPFAEICFAMIVVV